MASDSPGSVVYPEGQVEGFRTLSVTLALTSSTIISYCLAQRAYDVNFFSRQGLSSISIAKRLLLLLFLDSWAFVFLSGILVNGIGTSLNPSTCSLGIFTCIVFYCISKLLTYLFLLEKVYIVWLNQGGRLSSIPYRIGFCAILGFVLVLIIMVVGRIAYLTEDLQCVIGLQKASSLTTLFVDLFVNTLLSSLFLWPLWRFNIPSPKIRRVASRTLIASFAALAISAVNLSILTIVHGQELGWICLTSCTTDVVFNAIVLFWLTRPGHANDEATSGGDSGNHGPGHNNRRENGQGISGGVFQMRRINVTPGMHGSEQTRGFTDTSSINGISWASAGLRSAANTDDVSRPRWRSTSLDALTRACTTAYSHTPARGLHPLAMARRQTCPIHPLLLASRNLRTIFLCSSRTRRGVCLREGGHHRQRQQQQQRSKRLFQRAHWKAPPEKGIQRSFDSIQGGFGGRKRHGSIEEVSVRIAMATINEDTHVIDAAEASDPNSSSDDHSKSRLPRVV